MLDEVSESTLRPLNWYQDKTTVAMSVSFVALSLICVFGAVYAQWYHVGVTNVSLLSTTAGVTLLAALLPPLLLHRSRKKETSPEPDKLEDAAVVDQPLDEPSPIPVPPRLQHLYSSRGAAPPSRVPSLGSLQREARTVSDSRIEGVEEMPNPDEEELVPRDSEGNTFLHKLASKPRATIAFRGALRQKGKQLVTTLNAFRETPLHLAVKHGSYERAEELILAKADLTAQDALGNTPLHVAVMTDRSEIAKLLIGEEKGLDIKNDDGNTPLHLAATRGDRTTVLLLVLKLEKEALNATNSRGETALHIAAGGDFDDVAEDLIAQGAALDVENADKRTPLHIAVLNNCLKAAKNLVELGAPLNTQDKEGNTPLHMATIKKNLAMLLLLSQLGEGKLDMEIKNGNGLEPMAYISADKLTDQDWKDAQAKFQEIMHDEDE